MTDLSVDTYALILDLRRRVELLENGLYGHAAPVCDPTLLTRCYVEAHRVAKDVDAATASAWVAQAYLWDVRALVVLGRMVADPYPFRPLIAALDACVEAHIPAAEQALAHLEAVSTDLLVAQGLELIRPRDTMGQLCLEEALQVLARHPRSRK